MRKRYLIILLFAASVLIPIAHSQHAQFSVKSPLPSSPSSLTSASPLLTHNTARDTVVDSTRDHQATVYRVEGDVHVLKRDRDRWSSLSEGQILIPGDRIRTGKNSYVELSYDDGHMNIARIGAKTLAIFRSIEPTDILLLDGNIFSALDALPKDSSYQIATPVSVAAVRGTRFLRVYESAAELDGTYVSEGAVDNFPVGLANTLRDVVRVDSGEFLEFRPGAKEEDKTAKPMNEKQAALLSELLRQSQDNLEKFVKGETEREEAGLSYSENDKALDFPGGDDGSELNDRLDHDLSENDDLLEDDPLEDDLLNDDLFEVEELFEEEGLFDDDPILGDDPDELLEEERGFVEETLSEAEDTLDPLNDDIIDI